MHRGVTLAAAIVTGINCGCPVFYEDGNNLPADAAVDAADCMTSDATTWDAASAACPANEDNLSLAIGFDRK